MDLKDYEFKSVKITRDGLEANFIEYKIVDDESYLIKHAPVSSIPPHQDLVDLFKELKTVLIDSYGFCRGLDQAEKYLKGEQKAKVTKIREQIYSEVQVTKISVSGNDQLEGVVISGKRESWNGSYQALNTPRICFASDNIGHEDNAERLKELIAMEVYKYFYSGKYGEATLFDHVETVEAMQVA